MTDDARTPSGHLPHGQVHWRQLVDLIPDAVLIQQNERIIYVNDESVRLFGANSDRDLLGHSLAEFAAPEAKVFLEQILRSAVQPYRSSVPAEIIFCKQSGNPVRVELRVSSVVDATETPSAIVLLRDLSARQQVTDQQLRSENQVRTILDTAMDGIISIDEMQTIVLFNKAAEAIFGWKSEQVMGRSIDILIPRRYLVNHRDHVERFGQGEIPSRRMGVQRTVMALRATGEEFPIEASISHTKMNDSQLYTVILRDVTEATRYRQQIEQQSQMLDQVSEAVSVVDLQGQIIYWNQGAQRLFGWPAQIAIGQNAKTLFYGNRESETEALQVAADHQSWSGELTKRTQSGKTVIVDHRRTLLKSERGETYGYLCIDIDITNRKKLERLSHRSQRLESIGTLAGGIAHDLNNVLTPILMGAKLLASDRAPADRGGLLNTMVASAQRGAGLIQQLLAFAGGVRGERRPVMIEQIVAETRGLLEHTFPKSIQIETVVSDECPAVLGDSTELAQILMNLCINARDAMTGGGTLRIEAEPTHLNGNASRVHPQAKPGPYLILSVSDSGVGMSQAVLDRIFDPFFTTKEFGKGTGLGLATVQGLVASHGGFVLVYSELGRGSKFSIYLPTIASTKSTSAPLAGDVEVSGQNHLVLLVDDEQTIREMTKAFLEANGFRVITAQDGYEAVAKVSELGSEISVVLLDMMMPGMDGMETLDRILQVHPATRIIACSGLRTSNRETDVVERGAKRFLPKPYSDQQLLQVLSQTINESP